MAKGKFTGGRPFPKGHPGKQKGTVSKRAREWSEFGKAIVEGNVEWMVEHIEELKARDPERAMDRLLGLLEYFKPKLSRSEVKQEQSGEVKYTISFKRG